MSKTTPSYYSSISLNSKPIATASSSDGNTYVNYKMSQSEKDSYDYAQKEFAKNLQSINIFSPDTLKQLNDEVEAYKQNGIKTIKEVYTPILKNLQNDVASRFGNLDNSIFMDKLSEIEDKRAESINALAQDVESKKQELTQNELLNRYNYLNFLNDYNNQVLQNALSVLGLNKNYMTTTNNSNSSSNLTSQLAKVASLFGNAIL
ncbi:MAG: hypothetical protein E7Z91_01050 [Cyanobacteria bacterium SIG30]|nr:hypothetical protein [Cyanobacteria bacterium SIG30]